MIDAWIVIREGRHLDNRYWVCLNKEDALAIAAEVTEYWKEESPRMDLVDVDETLHGDFIFHYSAEDRFSVYVQPQQIHETSEGLNEEDFI